MEVFEDFPLGSELKDLTGILKLGEKIENLLIEDR